MLLPPIVMQSEQNGGGYESSDTITMLLPPIVMKSEQNGGGLQSLVAAAFICAEKIRPINSFTARAHTGSDTCRHTVNIKQFLSEYSTKDCSCQWEQQSIFKYLSNSTVFRYCQTIRKSTCLCSISVFDDFCSKLSNHTIMHFRCSWVITLLCAICTGGLP